METFLRNAAGDSRGFVHKRILGGLKGVVGGLIGGGPGGIIGGGIRGFIGGGRGAPLVAPISTVFQNFGAGDPRLSQNQRNTAPGIVRLVSGQLVPGRIQSISTVVAPSGCPPGFFPGPGGSCIPKPATFLPGGDPLFQRQEFDGAGAGPFEAVMGRYGAGFEPDVLSSITRRCGRGAVLGNDGICYNRRDLRNSDRQWPRGRRPLLTGGDMRAISTASAAAKKLQRKQKQLEQMGLLKRPAPRSRRALPHGAASTIPRVVQIQQE